MTDELSASIGTLGYERSDSRWDAGAGQRSAAGLDESQHYDGPFTDAGRRPQGKPGAALSVEGDAQNGASLTGMLYHQLWTNTTDIPLRAVTEGLVADRFGSLDPTDGGHALRVSLSANAWHLLGTGELQTSAFFIDNQLHLFNDFTHFLIDPVHGDQEDQFENRRVVGGTVNYAVPVPLGSLVNELSAGGLVRYDQLGVGRLPSEGQVPLPTSLDPPSYLRRRSGVSVFRRRLCSDEHPLDVATAYGVGIA